MSKRNNTQNLKKQNSKPIAAEVQTVQTGLRLRADVLANVDAEAAQLGLPRNAFIQLTFIQRYDPTALPQPRQVALAS